MSESTNQLEVLVKVFRHKEHADQFRKGILYSNPLSYFQGLEGQHGIADPFEGSMYSSENGVIKIASESGKMVDITPFLLGPVRFRRINHVNVICFHLWKTPVLVSSNTELSMDTETAVAQIPERLQEEFGSHLVIIHKMDKFINRVKAALEQLYINKDASNYMGDKVVYEDHKPIASMKSNSLGAAFYKRKKYAYQSEYRIAFELSAIDQEGGVPFKLDIGNIEDITLGGNSSQKFEFCAMSRQ